ncbi:MAG: cold shock domain-containing protein [Oleiphilaceae bacterium]|nr:cold shock domain-containing protein [Oleiphilaceae bacterium]
MSTQSVSKKIFISALVSLPFPFLLLLALDAGSGLPGDMGAIAFLGTEQGPNFYVVAWLMFVLAAITDVLLIRPSSSVAEEFEGDDDDDGGVDGAESGTVKWFNVNKGFGFITTDGGEDVFVHFRSIRGRGRRSLRQGQSVRFDITEGEKGLQAENVSVIK